MSVWKVSRVSPRVSRIVVIVKGVFVVVVFREALLLATIVAVVIYCCLVLLLVELVVVHSFVLHTPDLLLYLCYSLLNLRDSFVVSSWTPMAPSLLSHIVVTTFSCVVDITPVFVFTGSGTIASSRMPI